MQISEHGQNDATTGTRDPAAVGPGPSGKVEPDGRTSSREEKNRFDHVTKTVAELFRCPIVVVCLGDSAPRRYVTQRGAIDLAGVDWGPLPKLRETCVVEDASRAPAWADNPLVTGRPAMRFVAAAPVAPHGDVPVGALLVIDTVARPPEHGQPKVLASFADIIAAELAREDWVQALLSQVDAKRRQSIAASRADGQSRLRFAVDAYSAPCALVCTRAGGWSIAHYNQEWRDLFSMPKIAHRGPTEGRSASRIAQDPLATAVSAPIRRQLTADVSSRASAGLGIPPLHPRKGEPSDGGAASDAGAGLSALGSTVGVVSGDGSSGGAPFWSVLEPAERDASAEEKAHEASIAAQQPFRVAVHARKRRQKSGPPVVCVFKPTHDTNEVDMIEGASVSSPTTGGTLFFVTVEDDGAGQRETAPGDGYAPAGMLAPVAPFVDVKLGRLIGKGGYGEVSTVEGPAHRRVLAEALVGNLQDS